MSRSTVVQHSTLVPAPMPTPAPVLELTAAILPIAPAGPGGSGSPGAGGSVSGVRWGSRSGRLGDRASSSSELRALPMSGAAWDALKRAADAPAGVTEPGGSESGHECSGPGQGPGLCPHRDPRVSSRGDLGPAFGDGHRSRWRRRWPSAARLAAYVIAADLIGLRAADPALDAHVSSVAHSGLGSAPRPMAIH